jgi:hypothetical protein
VAIEQVGVFADPAEARVAGQCLFQYRRAVGERAIAVGADGLREPVGQLCQAMAYEPVIVAPECISRDVGE